MGPKGFLEVGAGVGRGPGTRRTITPLTATQKGSPTGPSVLVPDREHGVSYSRRGGLNKYGTVNARAGNSDRPGYVPPGEYLPPLGAL